MKVRTVLKRKVKVDPQLKICYSWGTWLAESLEHATLDLKRHVGRRAYLIKKTTTKLSYSYPVVRKKFLAKLS